MKDAGLEKQVFHYPNKMGRIVLLSLEEILGHTGINAVLNLAGLPHLINNYPPNTFDRGFRFDELGRIHETLDTLYGPHSGRGLALRAGRACFKYGLREFGSMMGVSDLAFRLLPLKMKIKAGGEALAAIFNQYSDQVVRQEETPDLFRWHIERCAVCWGRETDSPCCHMAVGVLQESLYWVSTGRHFKVEEVACIAQGDSSCIIQITREPLD